MNNTMRLVLACFVFSLAVNAQEPAVIGFRGGLNFSNIVGGDVQESPKSRIGFQAGFLAEFYLSRSLGVQGEILYSEQGFNNAMDTNGDGTDEEVQFNLNYVNLPIMLKYYITNNFCVALGPQIGVNVTSKLEIINGPIGAANERENLENLEFLDFSAGVGLSYKFDEGFFFQGRYLLGITPIRIFEIPDGETLDIRHSVFQVSAGFRF